MSSAVSGGGTTPNVVTYNDRQFACTLQSCGMSDPTSQLLGSINIHAEFLNIDALRSNIYEISKEVAASVANFKRLIEAKEAEFEMRFLLREVGTDVVLFNRVNATIAKLRRHRATLSSWYSKFQELISLALDYMATYSESEALIRNLGSNVSMVGGLPQSPVQLAKQNLSKSKSIQRQINNAIMADARLKTVLISIQTQVESFARGVIKSGDKLLDLEDLSRLIDGLSDAETPLARVQLQLSNIVNSATTNFKMETKEPRTLETPAMNFLQEMELKPPVDPNDVISRLETLSTRVLYTENTRPRLEQIFSIATKYVSDLDPRRETVERLVQTIRENLPTAVMQRYRTQIRITDGIYLRLQELKDIIANLDSRDKIYENQFREIYNETYTVALSDLMAESGNGAGGSGGNVPEAMQLA